MRLNGYHRSARIAAPTSGGPTTRPAVAEHRTLARSAVVLSVIAMVSLGLPGLAQAAPAGGGQSGARALTRSTTRQVRTGSPASQRLCATPKRGQFACLALRRTDVSAVRGLMATPNAAPLGFGPTDLRSAYAIPANGGAGTTVAVVDAQDDPSAEADLAVYRQQYGLTACGSSDGCFRKADQRGGTAYPPSDPDWSGEISLDLDMVSAVAPLAHILLVEADSPTVDNLGTAVDIAVSLGARYVSNSYGGDEDPSQVAADAAYYQHPGVAVVASSGDSDYGVQYPAASPYVTAVGGTSLVRDTSTRGWSETTWLNQYGGPGSGCSAYEPKPSFQKDTGCTRRTVADVSAVADPLTGVAVYQTYGGGGWGVYGGTSVASPIIASVYADAGTPATGTYPASYPYRSPSALNDVTQGSNGSCSPAYLCTAGPGYDGPTGLGTPNGLTAFQFGPQGTVGGTVTAAGTGQPIAGATISAATAGATTVTTTTGATGTYAFALPPGTYTLSAAAFGYATATVGSVTVTNGSTGTASFALTALPRATISGTVTDGSGHGYPLYAQITADGVPGPPVYTNPTTGAYQLSLPRSTTYHLHVSAIYPGYQPTAVTVALGTANVTTNVPVPVTASPCTAPGYQSRTVNRKTTCALVAGGLVLGTVTDANTGTGLAGATVTSVSAPTTIATTQPSAGNPAVGAGFYWLFSALTGSRQFTAAKTHYTSTTATAAVTANAVTAANIALKAGRLTVTPPAITQSVTRGAHGTATMTVTNTGGAAASVQIGESSGAPAATAWQSIPDYPTTIEDNTAGYSNGVLYSVFGWTGSTQTANLYSYHPGATDWTQLASASATRENAAGAFINGKLYVVGGWDVNDVADPKLEIYDPTTNTWTTGASDPKPYAESASAVLGGKLYVIAGCVLTCATNRDVEVYNPATNTWSTAAQYPEVAGLLACGAIGTQIYCAGGTSSTAEIAHSYSYNPTTNTWSSIADLPIQLSGAGYAAVNGLLVLSGGITAGATTVTSQGFAYNPVTGAWAALPTSVLGTNRGGSAPGFYRIGGAPALGQGPVATAQVLAGYDQTGAPDVPWLTESPTTLTLQPGASATVTVTLNAADPSITGTGTYTASLTLTTDTPYQIVGIPVSMQVN